MLTDFAESQLDDWARAPGAREASSSPRWTSRATPRSDVDGPLVVIANYVFDSLPADAFAVRDGVLEECLVEVGEELTALHAPPVDAAHYGDPDLDALLEHYRDRLDDTVVHHPASALGALRRLRELAGDRLLVLAADKALQHRGGARLPRGAASPPATAARSR